VDVLGDGVRTDAFTCMRINGVKELSAENKQMKTLICMDHRRNDCAAARPLL
jgi:hypothetical protein